MFTGVPRKKAIAPTGAALILKTLRERAGLSIRAMAAALGMKAHTAYQYYEDRYKKDHLPPDLYDKVREIFMAREIKESDIRALLDAKQRAKLEALERRVGNIESLIAEVALRHAEQTKDADEEVPPRRRKIH